MIISIPILPSSCIMRLILLNILLSFTMSWMSINHLRYHQKNRVGSAYHHIMQPCHSTSKFMSLSTSDDSIIIALSNVDNKVRNTLDIIHQQFDISSSTQHQEQQSYQFKPKTKFNPSLESCIIVAVDCTSTKASRGNYQTSNSDTINKVYEQMTIKESLNELQELVRTAGLQILDVVVQRMPAPLPSTYIGSGKVEEIIQRAELLNLKTIIFDDDLTTKQQRSLEELFSTSASSYGKSIKILDRTAVILEIFAKRANSREGQLQVELAMLEYRLTRGPQASGDVGRNNGAGFRGPGETKIETDKRVIRDKLVFLRKDIDKLKSQRQQHRTSREALGLPVVTLCGYTNAGKSTLMNRMSKAGVLAEDMLFATLDTTTRRVRIATSNNRDSRSDDSDNSNPSSGSSSSRQIMLTDTVGFISKLPTSLVAAFRSTLEEVNKADVLVHVVDRSNPTWRKQRQTVMRELWTVLGDDGMMRIPIIELWNKVDLTDDPAAVQLEAVNTPIDVEGEEWEDDEPESPISLSESPVLMTTNNDADNDNDYISEEADVFATPVIIPPKPPSTTSSSPLSPNIRVIAASAKTGFGLDEFYKAIIEAAATTLHGVDLIIPFADDKGLVSVIQSVGVIQDVSYSDTATLMSAMVPVSLLPRIQPYLRTSIIT